MPELACSINSRKSLASRFAALVFYIIAAFAVVITSVLSWLVDPLTHSRTLLLPMIPAVALAAWLGGLGPGLFATISAALLGWFLILPPTLSFHLHDVHDLWRVAFFVFSGTIISGISEALRRTKTKAEDSHRKAEERLQLLQESESRFRLLVDGVRDYAMFMLDAQGHVVTWNLGAERIHGYASDEIIGQPYSRFFTDADQADGKPQRLLDCAQREGRCADEGWRRRRDGSQYWADAIITAIRDENGGLRGFAKITRDITQRRETLIELAKAKEVAAEARRAKQFIAVLSHELRTPLTPLLAIASTLETDTHVSKTLRDDLRAIKRNAELEARLVDDLLDWSRIIAGKLNLHFEAVNVHTAAREALHLCERELEQKGLALQMNLNAGNPWVWADAVRLRQVLWNLLKNAVKFTESGGSVSVNSSDDGDRLVISVIDTGMGIDTEILPHIFDAYYQGNVESTRRLGGLGLGLTLAKAIAEAHHGSLTVDSLGPHRGATFTLALPAMKSEPARCEGSQHVHVGKNGCQRVLLVEDNEDSCRILARILRSQGHIVMTANSVASAMRVFETEACDLLISDLGLPDGTGWQLLRQMRTKRQIRAIAISGYGTPEDRRTSEEAGFAAHLTKPLDLAQLEQALHGSSTSCDGR